MKIVGFDAEPDEITALQQGTVQALIAQSPYVIGTDAVDQAVAALHRQADHAEDRHQVHHHHHRQPELVAASQAAIYKTSC